MHWDSPRRMQCFRVSLRRIPDQLRHLRHRDIELVAERIEPLNISSEIAQARRRLNILDSKSDDLAALFIGQFRFPRNLLCILRVRRKKRYENAAGANSFYNGDRPFRTRRKCRVGLSSK